MKYDTEGKLVDIRELTDEEYQQTYETGSGGHVLPAEVLADLDDEEDEGNYDD